MYSQQNEQYNLIDFNPLDIDESDEMHIQEFEKHIIQVQRKNYVDTYSVLEDPVSYIDGSYRPDDLQAYLYVKDQYSKDTQFYEKVLQRAKEEHKNAYIILKDYKDVFKKRLGIYDEQVSPNS